LQGAFCDDTAEGRGEPRQPTDTMIRYNILRALLVAALALACECGSLQSSAAGAKLRHGNESLERQSSNNGLSSPAPELASSRSDSAEREVIMAGDNYPSPSAKAGSWRFDLRPSFSSYNSGTFAPSSEEPCMRAPIV
jgi:hypothetical protein